MLTAAARTALATMPGTGCLGQFLQIAALVVASSLASCGGRTVDSGEEFENASAGGSAGGTLVLGACEMGFAPEADPERECAWLGEDSRCYDTKEAACACLCREGKGEYCLSELFSENDTRRPVKCF